MNSECSDSNLPLSNHLLKAEEVAERLNISCSYVYHLIQAGKISVVRLGRACRVRPEDLEAYIEKHLHTQLDDR